MLLLFFSGIFISLFGGNREPLNVLEESVILAAVCCSGWESGKAGDGGKHCLIFNPRRNKSPKMA